MRRLSAVIGAIVLAFRPLCRARAELNQPVSMYPAPAFEYVQQAVSLESDGKTMTLKGVPSTVFFSDRPYRLTGHMDNAAFAKLWQGPNGPFASIVPNAAVSVLGDTQNPPAIVELTQCRSDGRFDQIRDPGPVWQSSGSAESVALFVDHASRVHSTAARRLPRLPLSPGSRSLLLPLTAGSGVPLPPVSSLLSAVPALLPSGGGFRSRCGRRRCGGIRKPAAICLSDARPDPSRLSAISTATTPG